MSFPVPLPGSSAKASVMMSFWYWLTGRLATPDRFTSHSMSLPLDESEAATSRQPVPVDETWAVMAVCASSRPALASPAASASSIIMGVKIRRVIIAILLCCSAAQGRWYRAGTQTSVLPERDRRGRSASKRIPCAGRIPRIAAARNTSVTYRHRLGGLPIPGSAPGGGAFQRRRRPPVTARTDLRRMRRLRALRRSGRGAWGTFRSSRLDSGRRRTVSGGRRNRGLSYF
jgi:hypothetical protein